MKKFVLALTVSFFWAMTLHAQDTLTPVLSLLQQPVRTPTQTQQVFHLFRTAQDPNTIFAAGASLVRIPPANVYEPALLNQIMSASDPLKTAFSAIILTAMGSAYEELSPLLQDTLQSQDPVLRAYAAGAYALVNPSDKTHTSDIVRLYIFDPAFAQRAMNLLTDNAQSLFKILQKASSDADPQIRAACAAWLGTLHTQQALTLLNKRARKEKDSAVQTQLAMSLAAHPDEALPLVTKGLELNYKKPAATTYALALGFMTGHAISPIKTAILSTRPNQRINALRACAYMAGVLANPDGFAYSSDREFDIHLLKSLVPQITALARNGSAQERTYAQNALSQIEKLI